jgi:uncharacterized protein (TIGR03437 family)
MMKWSVGFLFLLTSRLLAAEDLTRPALAYSHAFGGSGADTATAVAVDTAGNVYIAGFTTSPNFPLKNPFRTATAGVGIWNSTEAFVTKWSADAKQLFYSSYLGGSSLDWATGIAVDRNGNAYVTGYTYSADFPVTAGAFQRELRGDHNAFVTKIGPNGELVYSTLLGGSGIDAASAIAVDRDGNAYVTGYAGSSDFPTKEAFQPEIRQGCPSAPWGPNSTGPSGPAFTAGDAFVAKINPGGSALVYSTYLGGTCADQGHGIALDSGGDVYIVGVTNSVDFPTTRGTLQENWTSAHNSGFLIKLKGSGKSLVYATFLGGTGDDLASAVVVDANGNAYVTGSSFGMTRQLLPAGSCIQIFTAFGSPFQIQSGIAAFVLKIDPAGSSRIYEQYLGECNPGGTSIAIDPAGRAWVAGSAGSAVAFPTAIFRFPGNSATFPAIHPFQALGLGRGFVSQISADGQSVLFSSLVDWATAMALHPTGGVYVVGATRNSDVVEQPGQEDMPYPALLVRIDPAVRSAVTIEPPRSMASTRHYPLNSLYPSVLAPGAIIAIPGIGLGPTQEIGPSLTPEGSLSTSLAGTSVKFDGIPAPLISVQAEKVVCIVPFKLGSRETVSVQVESSNGVSNAIRAPLQAAAVEILAVVNEDGTLNSANHPAAPGSVVTLYAAGMGQTDPPTVDGAINGPESRQLKNAMSILIHNWLAPEIMYAGPAPGQVAGIMQINFRVPDVPSYTYNLLLSSGLDQDFTILTVVR